MDARDYVNEAYECFIKNAQDIDPTDPVKAIEAHFEKNATEDLKARCKAEGKTAAGCWEFILEVAKKALGGHNGHIDPAVVYAIAMHWFQDVPNDWRPKFAKPAAAKPAEKKQTEKPAAKPKKTARQKGQHQGFFFDLLEGGEA